MRRACRVALTNSRGSDSQKEFVCIYRPLWKPDYEVRVRLRDVECLPKEVQKQVMSSGTCQSFPHHLTRCSDKAIFATAPNGPMGRQKAPPALLKPSSSKRWRTSSLRAAYKHLSPSNVCSQDSANSDVFCCDQDVHSCDHMMHTLQHIGRKFTTGVHI